MMCVFNCKFALNEFIRTKLGKCSKLMKTSKFRRANKRQKNAYYNVFYQIFDSVVIACHCIIVFTIFFSTKTCGLCKHSLDLHFGCRPNEIEDRRETKKKHACLLSLKNLDLWSLMCKYTLNSIAI